MTTTTRERFSQKFLGPEFSSSQMFADKYNEKGKLGVMMEDIIAFIETTEKEAEERGVQRGREEMRKECIEVVKTKTPWRQTRYISCLTHSISSLK